MSRSLCYSRIGSIECLRPAQLPSLALSNTLTEAGEFEFIKYNKKTPGKYTFTIPLGNSGGEIYASGDNSDDDEYSPIQVDGVEYNFKLQNTEEYDPTSFLLRLIHDNFSSSGTTNYLGFDRGEKKLVICNKSEDKEKEFTWKTSSYPVSKKSRAAKESKKRSRDERDEID